MRGACKRRGGLQLSRVAASRCVEEAEEHKAFFTFIFSKQSDCVQDQSSPCQQLVGGARPPALKERAAKCLVKLNAVTSVPCCFVPGCSEKVAEASSNTSAGLSCEFAETGGAAGRQSWCRSVRRGVAGEPHTCQLRLPQISLGTDQTTVCKC